MTTVTEQGAAVRVGSTGTRASRVIGALALVGVAWLVLFGMVISPADEVQGEAVRLLYIHVPTAWLAYLSFGVTALGSALYLWRRTRSLAWDRVAAASAEIGVVFTGLTLIAGAIYGRITWGVYWRWDARLTTTALLFVLFLGYCAIRRLGGAPEQRARRCAIAGLLAFIDVPIVHMSVYWWRTLHQPPTVLRPDLKVEMSGTMLFTLFVGVIAFTLIYLWLVLHRTRVMMMEDALDDHGLDLAIAERHAEAGAAAAVPAAPAGSVTDHPEVAVP
jgi:heme exporter protein C